MKKLDIIRRGDIVKVLNPIGFYRTGYDYTYETARLEVREKKSQEIKDFIIQLGFGDADFLPKEKQIADDGLYRTLEAAIAHKWFRMERPRDAERKLYTKPLQQWVLDGTFKVLSTFNTKTGQCVPPSGGYSAWDGEYDYEPGYLDGMKNHQIYILDSSPYCMTAWAHEESMMIEDIPLEPKPSYRYPDGYNDGLAFAIERQYIEKVTPGYLPDHR